MIKRIAVILSILLITSTTVSSDEHRVIARKNAGGTPDYVCSGDIISEDWDALDNNPWTYTDTAYASHWLDTLNGEDVIVHDTTINSASYYSQATWTTDGNYGADWCVSWEFESDRHDFEFWSTASQGFELRMSATNSEINNKTSLTPANGCVRDDPQNACSGTMGGCWQTWTIILDADYGAAGRFDIWQGTRALTEGPEEIVWELICDDFTPEAKFPPGTRTPGYTMSKHLTSSAADRSHINWIRVGTEVNIP